MSDDDSFSDRFLKGFKYWFSPPNPGEDEDDNIWSDFHIFDGHWIEIQNRVDWYESPNIPQIYKDHKYIFKQNMGMKRPEETFYQQNVDSNAFKSDIYSEDKLPSGKGKYKIETNIWTKNPPSGENDFGMVEYLVRTHIKYSIPNGTTFLPRILARPLNRFFKWAFLRYIGEEIVESDSKHALKKTKEYYNYMRRYHGEEPIQTKSREAKFDPSMDEGVFFH